MKKYLQTILKERAIYYRSIRKIQGEASTRSFFRVYIRDESVIAMVYPEQAEKEIERIIRLTDIYKQNGLNVPGIMDTFNGRILLLEDLGSLMAQKKFYRMRYEPKMMERYLDEVADILIKFQHIPLRKTQAVLGPERMKWEMDFFLEHAVEPNSPDVTWLQELRRVLHRLVDSVVPVNTFAHRDFHSRNMLVYKEGIYLVDFQDSLKAPPYYDLVSFAFDSYLDLGDYREWLFERLIKKGLEIDMEKISLTALQRNIKAMGTFGFQVNVRKNLSYKKYIALTLHHITRNPMYGKFFKTVSFPSF